MQSNDSAAQRGGFMTWVRLGLIALAFGCGWHSFLRLVALGTTDLSQTLVEFAVAATLLLFGLPNERCTSPEAAHRRILRYALGAAALACIWFGREQALIHGRELEAGILFVLAFAAFLGARSKPVDRQWVRQLAVPGGAPRPSAVSVGLALVALALGGAATYRNLDDHVGGLALWLAAVILLGAAAALADRKPTPRTLGDTSVGPPAWIKLEPTLLAVLTVATLLRIAYLGDFPYLIDNDEGRLGNWALRLWGQDEFPDLFNFGWNSFPHLAYTVQYAMVPFVGESYISLRLSSALIGILSLVPFVFWARRWWGRTAAVLGALFLAINHEHLFWSRIGLNNIHSAAVAGLILATFARALGHGRLLDYVLFGYATALGFHTYHASKSYGVLLALPALFLALTTPGLFKRHIRGAILALFAFALVVAPMLPNVYARFTEFRTDVTNRSDVHQLVDAYRAGDSVRVRNHLTTHVGDSFRVFFDVPRNLTIFGPFLAVPFALGVAWMLCHWRDPRHLFALAWLFGLLILGSMLTDWPPSRARLVGLLPVACVIPAALLARIFALVRQALPRAATVVALLVVLPLAGGEALDTIHRQFVVLPAIQHADIESFMCRTIRRQQEQATVYAVGSEPGSNPLNALIHCVTAVPEHVAIVRLPFDGDVVPLPVDHRGDAIIFVPRAQTELGSLIRYYYPGVRDVLIRDKDGNLLLTAFFLDGYNVLQTRNLRAIATASAESGRPIPPARQPAYDEQHGLEAPPDLHYPTTVEWFGQLWIPASGQYVLHAEAAQLSVSWAGTMGDADAPVARWLTEGWHPIRVAASLSNPDDGVVLRWRAGGGDWSPVPGEHLFAHEEPLGVRARYTRESMQAIQHHERLHRVIGTDWKRYDDDPLPDWFPIDAGTVEWSAVLDLEANRTYRVKLDASVPTELIVDGVSLLAPVPDGPSSRIATIASRGETSIIVRSRSLARFTEVWKVQLLWEVPGGGWQALAPYQPGP